MAHELPRSRRIAIRLLLVVASVAVAGAIVYAARERVLTPLILRLARGAVAEHLHAELSLSGLEGNWITHLIVEDLAIEQHLHSMDGTRPIVSIQGGRLEARYSPWGLLTGGIEGLRDVQVSAKSVVVGPPLYPDAEEPDAAPDETGVFPARIPRIRLDVECLEVALGSGRTLTAETLAVDAEDDRFRMDASLTWRDPSRTVAAPATLEGRYDPDRIELDTLRLGELLDVRKAGIDLPPGALAAAAEGTLLDGSFTLALTDETWQLVLEGAALEPVAALVGTELALAGRLDLSGEGALDGSAARVTLGARDLLVADVLLEALDTELVLAPDQVRVEQVRAQRGANRLDGEGWRVPRHVSAAELLRLGEGRVQLSIEDVPDLLARDVPTAPPHRITLDGRLGQGVLSLAAGEVETAGGTLSLSRGSLRLGETGELGEAELALQLAVDFDQLEELARLFGSDDLQGGLLGTLAVDGSLRELGYRLEGDVTRLLIAGRELGDGQVAATYGKDRLLSIERLELDGGLGKLSCSGAYSTVDATFDDVRLEAHLGSLEALGLADLTAGQASISADLTGPLAALRGFVSIDAAGLVYADSPVDVVTLRGLFEGSEVRVEELVMESDQGRVTATARLLREATEGWSATISSLEATRGTSTLSLAETAELRYFTPERWSLSPFVLHGNAGLARVAAERTADGLTASLVCEDFDPLPLTAFGPFEAWSTSGMNAQLDVERRGEELRAVFDVSVPSLHTGAQDQPWKAVARGTLASGRLRIERLEVEHEEVGMLVAQGDVPLDPLAETPLGPGALELTADLQVELEAVSRRIGGLPPGLAGRTRTEIHLTGEWQALRGELRLASDDLALAPLGSPFEASTATLQLELVADQEGCRLGPALLETPTLGTIEAEGTLATSVDLTALLAGETPAWREALLDLQLELALEDLTWLAGRTKEVRRTGGHLRGRLGVSGPAGEPDFEGTLALSDGAFRLSGGIATLDHVGAQLRLRGREILLEGLQGEFGGSPFSAEGTLDLGGDEPRLSFRLQGQNLLLTRQSGLRLRADTELEVAGPFSQLATSGKILLTEGRYGRDIDFLGALRGEAGPPTAGGRRNLPVLWRDGPLSQMTLDVEVHAKAPLLVKNNVAAFEVRPELRLNGTGEVPLLVGTVYIDPGRVGLPSGTLSIESGRIDFREDAPLAPRLELIGRTRIKGYDIGVRVSGDALAPEVELWSTPPLPGEDLLVLFLTGELPEGSSAQGAAQSVAVYLARDYITRWMQGSGESDDTVFQRIEIDVGADVTRSGAPTTRIVYYISDRPRSVGWVPYLSANRDKYDKYDMGVGVLFRLR